MKIFPECKNCLRDLIERSAKLVTKNKQKQKEILKKFDEHIAKSLKNTTTIEVGQKVRQIIYNVTGIYDPYKKIKTCDNRKALAIYPEMKRIVKNSKDPLLTAIRFAITGNLIDFTITKSYESKNLIKESLARPFAVFDYKKFLRNLSKTKNILYLGDNAGEIVFDKLLVEELIRLNKKITFAVRGKPAINDATLKDAKDVGMNKLAKIITSGVDIPGTLLHRSSSLFKKEFKKAKLIVSKGQGHFEGLFEEKAPIFFLFKAKCLPIARLINVKQGGMVFKKSNNFHSKKNLL